jgi:hypothetical protein
MTKPSKPVGAATIGRNATAKTNCDPITRSADTKASACPARQGATEDRTNPGAGVGDADTERVDSEIPHGVRDEECGHDGVEEEPDVGPGGHRGQHLVTVDPAGTLGDLSAKVASLR